MTMMEHDNTSQPVVRIMEYKDIDSILDLEHKCFSLPWSKGMFEDELVNPNAIYLVLEISGRICGYAGMWKIINEGHITNVAVHPDYRRKGYGTLLIKSLIQYAMDNGIEALTLEVRVSNTAAISLYESLGFRVEGRRKRYYSDNNEDAYIMWLFLTNEF